jgi:DnaJ-class molecular chaperone
MSVGPPMHRGPADEEDYEQANRIPPENRCLRCAGTGVVRLMNSMHPEQDYMDCFTCQGRGRKPKEKECL